MTPERAELYALCEETGTGITVMKGYMGGRLFDAATSPFGVALTPVQCLEYALTRPAVASVMVGFATPEHIADAVAFETASAAERDYAHVLAGAPAAGEPSHVAGIVTVDRVASESFELTDEYLAAKREVMALLG